MSRYLPQSTPAALLLAAALFTAAAGGAVAGGKITGAQIKDGTITSIDVKDASLRTRDLTPVARAQLRAVPYSIAQSMAQPVPSGGTSTVQVECPSGTVVIGGDVLFERPEDGVLQDSGPLPGDDVGWFVTVGNTGGAVQLVRSLAHCANLG